MPPGYENERFRVYRIWGFADIRKMKKNTLRVSRPGILWLFVGESRASSIKVSRPKPKFHNR